MHASHLVELAAIVAGQNRLLCQQPADAKFWAADQFWVLSRARVNEWTRCLQRCETLKVHGDRFDPGDFWNRTRPVIEEVLLSEVCTRIWCATLSTVEQIREPGELDPIARSVFIANLEARRRALRLILFAKGLSGLSTSSANELRLTCESWTDYLLAELPFLQISQQYCFDRSRIKRIYAGRHGTESQASARLRQRARMTAIHSYLATAPLSSPTCIELNSEIGALLLSCLPSAAFDGSGIQHFEYPASADMMSIDILADLFGTVGSTRFDLRSGMKDSP